MIMQNDRSLLIVEWWIKLINFSLFPLNLLSYLYYSTSKYIWKITEFCSNDITLRRGEWSIVYLQRSTLSHAQIWRHTKTNNTHSHLYKWIDTQKFRGVVCVGWGGPHYSTMNGPKCCEICTPPLPFHNFQSRSTYSFGGRQFNNFKGHHYTLYLLQNK